MNFINTFLIAGAAILALMIVLWLLSLLIKNSSIVDIFWGIGFIVIVWLTFALTSQGYLPRKQLVAVLVTIWGLRLSLHIGIRNWGKPEDFRYAKWRQESGPRWWWISFFKVFLLQGFLTWIISSPLVAAMTSQFPAILTPLDILGVSIWTLGLLFESVGDLQLMRFKADKSNSGKILTTGLWRYSRHPNYFGEAVLWWGYFMIAFAAGLWWTIISPLLMMYLLLKISGVVMLERTLDGRPGYQEYMERTSPFIPWLPKK